MMMNRTLLFVTAVNVWAGASLSLGYLSGLSMDAMPPHILAATCLASAAGIGITILWDALA